VPGEEGQRDFETEGEGGGESGEEGQRDLETEGEGGEEIEMEGECQGQRVR
jgi:hypothetical protein